MAKRALITADRLREVLNYDPGTGTFTRLTSSKGHCAGVAGCTKGGSVKIGVDNREYSAARLAWLYMTGEWPDVHIWRINQDTTDNRWLNLRLPGVTPLTAERVREILYYDPEAGVFTWRVSPCPRIAVGDVAGSLQRGYRLISIDGRRYRGSRIAWLYMTGAWPNPQVDHINLDGCDDRWTNLREATQLQNMHNLGTFVTNTSGLKGACRKRNKWRARIKVNGKGIHLGHFDTREAAFRAYADAALKYFGEFAKTRTIGDARRRYGLQSKGGAGHER